MNERTNGYAVKLAGESRPASNATQPNRLVDRGAENKDRLEVGFKVIVRYRSILNDNNGHKDGWGKKRFLMQRRRGR